MIELSFDMYLVAGESSGGDQQAAYEQGFALTDECF